MASTWDLLIKGATFFDGSGDLPAIQDVAVREGKVVARGENLPAGHAEAVVEASGQWLLPGLLVKLADCQHLIAFALIKTKMLS